MSEATWDRVKAIFDQASPLPVSERAALLERVCGGDERLRAEVEALLASHDELQAADPATRTGGAELPAEQAGSVIGRYKLLQRIGEGGFGTVYMAEQERPVRRRVALKIVKLGMDTKQVIARFEAERQALALMDHPNIAKVLDAGATDAGRPYFVMELVRGIPITEYCDQNRLGTRRRLELFMAVCGAVQHAHQKGVIHRDIKPSNVMVTLHDGTPVPKIIDFGIAKATNQRLTERTLFTEYNQFIGTPAYMSPEQAEMSGLDVDTRTDIYSLGVLLYELLTGSTPLDAQQLSRVAYSEIQRLIREQEPHRPSVRISTLGRAASAAAEHRRTDLDGLARLLRGDLDWVVMKALEKDRTRRYETANGLRMDIQRYLSNEPVSASPPRAVYRLRKFVRRNRTAVTIGATVLAALVGGLLLAGAGWVQARREAAASRAINGFFTDMLASVDPLRLREHSGFAPEGGTGGKTAAGLRQDVSVIEMMLRARAEIEPSFRGKPLLEATARETLGLSLLGLGRPREAAEEFDRTVEIRRAALGAAHPDTVRSELQLGEALSDTGRASESIPLLEAARKKTVRLYGERDPRALLAATLWAGALCKDRRNEEADPILAETLERQREILGLEHRDTLQTMKGWAWSRHWRGQGAAAEKLSRPAYEAALRAFGPDDALTLDLQSTLGWSRNFQGDHRGGEALLRPAVAGLERVLGSDHPSTCRAKIGLGRSLDEDEHGDEKERLWTEALEGERRTEGATSIGVYVITRDLAFLLLRRGKAEQGLDLLRRGLDEFREAFGEERDWTRDYMDYLARGLWRAGRQAEARQVSQRLADISCRMAQQPDAGAGVLLQCERQLQRAGRDREAVRLSERRLDLQYCQAAERPEADATTLNECAWALLTGDPAELRDPARALPLARRAVELADADVKALILDTLARALQDNGRVHEAVEAQRKALSLLPEGETETRVSLALSLARYLVADGAAKEARDVLVDTVETLAAASDEADEFVRAVDSLSNGHGLSLEPAEKALRRALALVRERWPGESAAMAGLTRFVAGNLMHQGRFAEAEKLARESLAHAEEADDEKLLRRGRILLAELLRFRSDPLEARSLSAAVVERYGQADGGQVKQEARRLLGAAKLAAGDARAAEPLLHSVVESYVWEVIQDPWRQARAESTWGESLLALGRFDEAEPLLLRSRKVLERELGSSDAFSREAARRIEALDRARGTRASAR